MVRLERTQVLHLQVVDPVVLVWVFASASVQLSLLGKDACLNICMKLLIPILFGVPVAPTVDGLWTLRAAGAQCTFLVPQRLDPAQLDAGTFQGFGEFLSQ